jgi:hypothetical protein
MLRESAWPPILYFSFEMYGPSRAEPFNSVRLGHS